MTRSSLLFLLLGIVVGCSPQGDDDTVEGDDDSAAAADDDDSAGIVDAVSAVPADGQPLSWDQCVLLEFDEAPANLAVEVTADGSVIQPFVGQAEEDVVVLPRDPWPVGATLSLRLTWDGGDTTLTYPVETPVPTVSSPVGTAMAVDLSFGHVCPDYLAVSLVLPTSYHALVEVTGDDGVGGLELLLGYSLANTTEQDLCTQTVVGEGSYATPLVRFDVPTTLYPWAGFLYPARRSWMAVQLDPAGGPPTTAAFGMMLDSWTLDELVGGDACAQMEAVGAPWCGPCPDEPAAECTYLYFHSAPTMSLDTPIQPRSAADIEVDPSCEE